MRQAITARYAGPTNTRGTRVLVRAQAGRMSVAWDYALSADGNYAKAVRLFAEHWGWGGVWVLGRNHHEETVATCVTDGGTFEISPE